MKKNFIALAAVFTLLSLNANAANIAVLDVEKIVKESVAMVDIQKRLPKNKKNIKKKLMLSKKN